MAIEIAGRRVATNKPGAPWHLTGMVINLSLLLLAVRCPDFVGEASFFLSTFFPKESGQLDSPTS